MSLASVLEDFRDHGLASSPVYFGTHRRAEGVIIPIELYRELVPAIDDVLLRATVQARLEQNAEGIELDAELVTSFGLDPADFDL